MTPEERQQMIDEYIAGSGLAPPSPDIVPPPPAPSPADIGVDMGATLAPLANASVSMPDWSAGQGPPAPPPEQPDMAFSLAETEAYSPKPVAQPTPMGVREIMAPVMGAARSAGDSFQAIARNPSPPAPPRPRAPTASAAQSGDAYLNRPDVQAAMDRYAGGQGTAADESLINAYDPSRISTGPGGQRSAPLLTGLGDANLSYKGPGGPDRYQSAWQALSRQQQNAVSPEGGAYGFATSPGAHDQFAANVLPEVSLDQSAQTAYGKNWNQLDPVEKSRLMQARKHPVAGDIRPSGIAPPADGPRPQPTQADLDRDFKNRYREERLRQLSRGGQYDPLKQSQIDLNRARAGTEGAKADWYGRRDGRRRGGAGGGGGGGMGGETAQQQVDAAKALATSYAGGTLDPNIATQLDSAGMIRDPRSRKAAIDGILGYVKDQAKPETSTEMKSKMLANADDKEWVRREESARPGFKLRDPHMWVEAKSQGRGIAKSRSDMQQARRLFSAINEMKRYIHERDTVGLNATEQYAIKHGYDVAVEKANGALAELSKANDRFAKLEQKEGLPGYLNPYALDVLEKQAHVFNAATNAIIGEYGWEVDPDYAGPAEDGKGGGKLRLEDGSVAADTPANRAKLDEKGVSYEAI